MSSQQQNRQPKGTPIGGQFAEGRRAEADVQLLDAPTETLPETYAIDRALEVSDGQWSRANSPYLVKEAIVAHGPGGRLNGRQATVFPWQGGWRYVVTEPIPGSPGARREVVAENTETVEEAIHWAEGDLGWGETGIHEGSRTPWGPAQGITDLAPGITVVDTDSHGGIKLSPERNKEVPAALRRRSGWYEEGCEAHIVRMTFPFETRPRISKGYGGDVTAEENSRTAHEGVRDWFPDEYEKATGKTVEPGQSRTRDYDNWTRAHADDWVVTSGRSAGDGVVEVTATRHGEEKTFHVPADEYRARHDSRELGRRGRFVVDPARHQEVEPAPEPPKTPTQRYTEVKLDGLTEAQRARVEKELGKLFRDEDGTVSSVGDLIASGQISGKTVGLDGGKRVYYLSQQQYEEDSSYSVLPVSKATWDAFQGPDQRTPLQAALQDVEYHRHRVEQLGGRRWGQLRVDPEVQRAAGRLKEAEERVEALRAERDGDA